MKKIDENRNHTPPRPGCDPAMAIAAASAIASPASLDVSTMTRYVCFFSVGLPLTPCLTAPTGSCRLHSRILPDVTFCSKRKSSPF